MNNKQMKGFIEQAFNLLYPLTYTDFTDYRAQMLDYELKAEKDHRRICPWDLNPKFTATVTAKYFVLKAVRSAMLSNDFRPRDILHCKQSYILAHAIKDDDRFDLDAMFEGFDWEAFEAIDYTQGDLVFVETVEQVA